MQALLMWAILLIGPGDEFLGRFLDQTLANYAVDIMSI